jgi:hypothetical protein
MYGAKRKEEEKKKRGRWKGNPPKSSEDAVVEIDKPEVGERDPKVHGVLSDLSDQLLTFPVFGCVINGPRGDCRGIKRNVPHESAFREATAETKATTSVWKRT